MSHDDDDGFAYYEQDTVDPGYSLLVATAVFCVASNLLLPCFVTLGRRRAKRRVEEDDEPNEIECRMQEENTPSFEQGCHSRRAKPSSSTPELSDAAYGLELPKNLQYFTQDEKSTGTPCDNKADKAHSVCSSMDNRSTISDSFFDTGVVQPYRNRRTGKARRKRGVEQRRRLRYNEHLESTKDQAGVLLVYDLDDNGSDMVREETSSRLTHRSIGASHVPNESLSPEDAVDHVYPRVTAPATESLAVEEVDLCCGPRAWWKPSVISRAWGNFLDLVYWDIESKRLVHLALPFSIAAVVEGALELVAIALIARYIGTNAVAAFTTVATFVELSVEFVGGFSDAISVVCPHAIGARNNFLAGQYLQICTILFSVMMGPMIVVWCFAIAPIMRAFGFDEATAQMAQEFTYWYVFAELVGGVHNVYCGFLSVIDREVFVTVVAIVQGLLSTGLILTSVLTRETTLTEVGVILLFVEAVMLVANLLFTIKKGWVSKYLKGAMGSFALKNRTAVVYVLKTAIPLCLGSLVSYGEWEILTIFAGHLGPAEVATWGILGTLWDTLEAISEGVADAGEIRCAYHLGRGRPLRAKNTAYKCTILGLFAASIFTSIIFIVGEDMAYWLTSDPTLQRMIVELLPMVGIGNITLTAGSVCWALVGSQGRYRLATITVVVASWCVTMPLAALFTYVWGINLQGVTSAVVVGFSVAGTILTYILLVSDWERLSNKIVERNAAEEEDESSSSSSGSSSSSSSSSVSLT